MTTTAQPTTTTRFRHIDDNDIIYIGEAEITQDDEVTILSAWRIGTTIEEVFPYQTKFPVILRRELENCAMECRSTPPLAAIELPTDWDEIEILDVEMNYTIAAKAILPEVKTDAEAKIYGLSAVKLVRSMNAGKQYQVTAKGGLDDIRRELHRIKIF